MHIDLTTYAVFTPHIPVSASVPEAPQSASHLPCPAAVFTLQDPYARPFHKHVAGTKCLHEALARSVATVNCFDQLGYCLQGFVWYARLFRPGKTYAPEKVSVCKTLLRLSSCKAWQ